MVARDLLQDLLEVWTPEERRFGQGLRLSSAGHGARKLAFDVAGFPREIPQPRAMMTFQTGDLLHDHVRDVLAEECDWMEVLDREREVYSKILVDNPEDYDEDDLLVPGHIDLRLRDTERDRIMLVDIKTMSHFSYVKKDPQNPHDNYWKRMHNWKGRNYSFDAWEAYRDDLFNVRYLYQLASYADACEREGIEWDELVFVCVNKNTGHLAVGELDSGYLPELLDDRDERFLQALEADSPYDLPLCYDNEVGEKVDVRCRYCSYVDACMDVSYKKGLPNKLKAVRDEGLESDLELMEDVECL